jgi:hypothetical protein
MCVYMCLYRCSRIFLRIISVYAFPVMHLRMSEGKEDKKQAKAGRVLEANTC